MMMMMAKHRPQGEGGSGKFQCVSSESTGASSTAAGMGYTAKPLGKAYQNHQIVIALRSET